MNGYILDFIYLSLKHVVLPSMDVAVCILIVKCYHVFKQVTCILIEYLLCIFSDNIVLKYDLVIEGYSEDKGFLLYICCIILPIFIEFVLFILPLFPVVLINPSRTRLFVFIVITRLF